MTSMNSSVMDVVGVFMVPPIDGLVDHVCG
jgi:hypothetical protein